MGRRRRVQATGRMMTKAGRRLCDAGDDRRWHGAESRPHDASEETIPYMLETLRRVPFFVVLLPLFFVLHGVLENFGFVPVGDALLLVAVYTVVTMVVEALAWLVLRDTRRAAIGTAAIMGFYFFYEAFIQWVTRSFPHRFFSRNAYLLGFGLLALVAVFAVVRKSKRKFSRLVLFLNVLLLVYVATDTGWLIVKALHPPVNPLSIDAAGKNQETPPCAACAKPNVYFLLFDEYAGSAALRQQYHFDNGLDSCLLRLGFHLNGQSRANYNLTPFSMASVLNMAYIDGIREPRHILSQDYTNTYQLIRDSRVVRVFSAEGYALKNYSIFDLAGHPARASQSFLPLKTRLITARTMGQRLQRHWNSLVVRDLGIRYFVVQDYMQYAAANEEFLKEVASEADRKDDTPKFIYAHFMMPHFPYLYDSSGRRRSDAEIYAERSTNPASAYLGYVQYTNRRLEPLLEQIRLHDPGAVILVCGDHGYRGWANRQDAGLQFHNLNAVFFPDHDYSRWKDSCSFVNQFRTVFNQLFHAGYPLLKDSTVLLSE
jgi:hypothetical protein